MHNESRPVRALGSVPITCTACAVCPAHGCSLRTVTYDAGARLSRRGFAAGMVITGAMLGTGEVSSAQTASSTPTTGSQLSCTTMTPELTEGPYYIEDALLRDDITEGKPGVPLELAMTVVDGTGCAPFADVAVDIWHCDAAGDYSGVSAMGNDDTTGQTYLRGIQLTGQDGVATIRTIYPGWYVGRATHIHLKVHTGGVASDGTYVGGTVAHTGQLFFDDEVTDQVAETEAYRGRSAPRTRNNEDSIFGGGYDLPGFMVTLTRIDANDIEKGFRGTVTLIIDPDAER